LVWSAIALKVQIGVYFMVNDTGGRTCARIAAGERDTRDSGSGFPLAAGALNAASMIYDHADKTNRELRTRRSVRPNRLTREPLTMWRSS